LTTALVTFTKFRTEERGRSEELGIPEKMKRLISTEEGLGEGIGKEAPQNARANRSTK